MPVRHLLQWLRPLRRINFFFFRFANGEGEPITFNRSLCLHLIVRLSAAMKDGFPLAYCPHKHGCIWERLDARGNAVDRREGDWRSSPRAMLAWDAD